MNPKGPERLMFERLSRLTHASMVKSCSCRFAGFPTIIPEPVPSNTKACPTKPGAKVVLPVRVPRLAPTWSEVSPSARHQLTRFSGGLEHRGRGLTVRTALELSAVPLELVTLTT